MEEIIKYLEEIKKHQMQTVQLARSTEVYKLADKALAKALPIHGVMGSFIKELNWIDKPKKKASDIYKVMADAKVPMPHTVGNAHIEITEQNYPCHYYEATLWCFNQGTNIAEGNSIIECKNKAFEWWSNFVCGFLNCIQHPYKETF